MIMVIIILLNFLVLVLVLVLVVQTLLDHPVPGGGGDYHHDDGRDDVDVDFLGAEEVSLFLTVNK